MLKIFDPIAVNPPSANPKHCTTRTIVRIMRLAQGPRRTDEKTAPRKWPLVPPATGKLSIWAAKIKAAVTPIRGTSFSPKVWFTFFTA
jgi:hypothetical protein